MASTQKPPLQSVLKPAVHTVTLTPDVVEAIQQLSREATDALGRRVSGSAILRALVRQCVRQGPAATQALILEVERELNAGVRWGKKK